MRISWNCQQMLYSLKMKGSDPMLKRTLKIKCLCADYSESRGSSGGFRRCRLHLSICWAVEDAYNQLRCFEPYLVLYKGKIHSDNMFNPAL